MLSPQRAFVAISLWGLFAGSFAWAGTNAGFTASIISPLVAQDPQVGQVIEITVEVQHAVQAKGGLISAKFDAAVIEFTGFTAGPLCPGMLVLPGTPAVEGDGLTSIQGGGTQLFGTPGSGTGLLGTMAFKIIAKVPAEGSFISVVDVQIQASSSDKDNVTFEVGEFGVALITETADRLSGDFDGSGTVDFDDFFQFADAFGSKDAAFDLDGSGQVDFDDFFIFADNFGKTTDSHPVASNVLPVANAGPDQIVEVGSVVQLDGSGSHDADGDVLSCQWTTPSGITLSSTTDMRPLFAAVTAGEYTLTLIVNDGIADSAPDQVKITVEEGVPEPSGALNIPPGADAGPDQTVEVGTTVTLDGSGSSDADGDVLSYRWTAPSGIALSSTTAIKPRFTATKVGRYTFTLVVNDGTVDSVADQVRITFEQSNTRPIANAGPDQIVEVGSIVQLDGSGSSDPDGDMLSYRWITLSSLNNVRAIRPRFTATKVGRYTFTLVVNDGTLDSVSDQVKITVEKSNTRPIANAGPDQIVEVGSMVQLDGSGSSDPDGDVLTYQWTAPWGDTTEKKPLFSATKAGTYILTLLVNDGTIDSAPDQVEVRVIEVVVETVEVIAETVIESKVDGTFNGWDGNTIVKLTNGQVWQQSKYHYEYDYAYRPDVLLYRDGATWTMRVEGTKRAVEVEELKDVVESKVDGVFTGWYGDTVVELMNGQVWQQSDIHIEVTVAVNPEVLLYRDGATWKMWVDGTDRAVRVMRQ